MNVYTWLLLWQALLAGSAFWIKPDGWMWFLAVAGLIVLAKWALTKYSDLPKTKLALVQTGFTIVLAVVILLVLSMQGTWHLFWIDLAGSLVFLVLCACAVKNETR